MTLSFGAFEVDPALREVRHEGRLVVVQPLVFDLLLYFLRHPNVMVTKEALIRDVWKGVVVGDGAITQAISLLRRTLRPGDPSPSALRTVWGRGYRFVAAVRTRGADAPATEDAATALPPARPPFVGRTDVMALLDRALEEARAGESRVVLLSGEPGIGKTRTCLEFAAVAESRGARAFVARVPETGGAPSYWPWTELRRQALAPSGRRRRSDRWTAALRNALMPDGRLLDDGEGDLLPHERERLRFEHFEQVASFWTSLAATGAPVVVIIDDVHRADVESLELLNFVADRGARASIVFVATMRAAEVQADEARAHAVGLLARRANAVSERLERFGQRDVAELVAILTGEACDDARAAALLDRSGGNPFLLKELVWLSARRSVAEGPGEPAGLPAGLVPAIERHLDVVSPACRELLAAAAVMGRTFEAAVLAALTETPVAEVLGRIDEAVRAEVVTALPAGRHQFVHALVRDAVYEALATPQRIALHARIGRAIEATYGTGDEHVEALAHHFHAAARAGEAERSLAYSTRAAHVAARAAAFRKAMDHFRRAIEVAPLARAGEATALRLQIGLAEAAANAGDFETVRREARDAMDRARRLDDAFAFARAAHAVSLGNEADVSDPTVTQAVEEAVERYREEGPLRVRLLARLANAKWFSAPPAVSRDLALRAVEAGRRVGDPDSLVHALTRAYRIFLGTAEEVETRTGFAREMQGIVTRVRGPAARLDLRWHLLGDAVERGDRLAFDERVDAMLREAAASPHPFAEWYAAFVRTAQLHLDGRFADAEAEARRALGLAAPGAQFAGFVFGLQMHGIRLAQGRMTEHLDEFRAWVRADRPPVGRVFVALAEAESGQRRDADALFTSVVADDLAAVPRDVNWMLTLAALADLAVVLGRADAATAIERHLRPFEDHHVWLGASWLHAGSVARRLGLLAEILGRHDDALRLVRKGTERDEAMGAPAFVALGRYECARLLSRRNGGRGARTEARALAEAALADAERLGLVRVRAETEALLGR